MKGILPLETPRVPPPKIDAPAAKPPLYQVGGLTNGSFENPTDPVIDPPAPAPASKLPYAL